MIDAVPAPQIDPAMEAAYLGDQRRAHWPATLAGFEAASAEVVRHPAYRGDLVHGPHERERFDHFATAGAARGVLIYLHPGFWQMRDRTLFRCLMPVFADLGLDVVTLGHRLCPDVTLADLTESVRRAVPAVLAHQHALRGHVPPIVAAGHSAGAHLAVELALTDWAGRGAATSPIAGVLALSGIYDLEPLIATSLDAALRLDGERARAASPIRRVAARGCPALFAVGAAETPAFRAQTRDMAAAWRAAGHPTSTVESPGDDHFSLIETLRRGGGPLARAIEDLLAISLR